MYEIPANFDENTYSKCVAELEKMLLDISFDSDIEESLLATFAVMEGSNNPLDKESKIVARAEAYSLITRKSASDLVMRDIKAQRAYKSKAA